MSSEEKSMFLPRSAAPPKEGRLRPGAPRYGPPGGQRHRRTLIIALVAAVVIFLFFFLRNDPSAITSRLPSTRPPKSTTPQPPNTPTFQKGEQAVQAHEEEVKKEAEAATGVKSHAEIEKAAKEKTEKPAAKKEEEDDDVEEEAKAPKKTASKPAEKPETKTPAAGAKLPSVEKALEKVLKLLPDEFTQRELLRAFDSGGKERMRELGMRTRQYKNFFDAWEELHLVEDADGRLSVRDDIVQLMRAGSLGSAKGAEGLGHMVRSYETFRSFIGKLSSGLYPFTAPYWADHVALHAYTKNGGRGIALTAGDDQAPMLMTVIHSIRNVGCKLPIEVMYLGDKDLGEDYRSQLEELDGVITRDISQMVTDDGWELAGWAAKPYAILLSSFREVIFIDADSFFLQNPEIMFEEPSYMETGALFFRDRLILPESKKRFLQQLLPKPIPKIAKTSRFWTGESGHQQESGVLVVDKWRHFLGMLLTCRLNGSDRDTRDGKTGVYELMYGDKETFWLGFLLAGDEAFAFHLGDAAAMGIIRDEQPAAKDAKPDAKEGEQKVTKRATPKTSKLCAPQLLHLDTKGKPLWFNGGLVDNKFADKKKRKLASFKSYLVEPKQLREPTPWQLGESNMACLDSEFRFDFTEGELKLLNSLLEHHKKIKEAEMTR